MHAHTLSSAGGKEEEEEEEGERDSLLTSKQPDQVLPRQYNRPRVPHNILLEDRTLKLQDGQQCFKMFTTDSIALFAPPAPVGTILFAARPNLN